ncbi:MULTISPECIES: class I SAM-dependent methyltransferase [Rhodanobacter]|uniref:class I SAM-dependent methyltransferase n=1 Tax=Rhodanobacter TaxID=75309 RepID=UPI000260F81E|nr:MULTISPECIES: class I SAM-dependent methyltransferase [Rhodanobacter]EIL97154.1 type 11 methyltransferase [Rhodanobacter thiooxydans LCS2]UJJ59250.1 class I SAM-dependent methyltransferase [Rhodanobacter denitrificans]
MIAPQSQRLPHAVLDQDSRNRKALKIERLLGLANRGGPLHILEIGTGSGGIAHYFGTHQHLHCEVTAVDISDNRLVHEGYCYQQVQGVELPFGNAGFDVVISNHVIEHVGDAEAQAHHLAEIRRVMKPGGDGYLAVPNRWMLTEPHYRLMFLSWWPHSWRTPYLRLMRKGEFYDCEPIEKYRLERMLCDAGLGYRNLCIEAMRETLAIERPQSMVTHILGKVPDWLLKPLRGLIPTLIYRIDRR